jgi:hypothetical protein
MKKILGTIALVLIAGAWAPAPKGTTLVCEKTGVVVGSCCCVVTGTTMVCTLTGEAVSDCCCHAAG